MQCDRLSIVLGLGIIFGIMEPSIAQVTPLGNTTVSPSGTITGGTTSLDGRNLFHRFDQFNVMTGQRVLFDPNAGVKNILSRISQASMIDGLVQVNGNANLFLMSPSGILFGSNARVNLNGNLFATTATGVGFQNGSWNGDNDPRSLVGDPSSFLFNLGSPSAIVNGGRLESVGTVALIGGQIANTGTVKGEQVSIVAVPGSQRVQIGDPNGVLRFEFQPIGTVNQTLQDWTPNKLSDLVAKGRSLNHGTRLEQLPDGTVRVVGSSLSIGNQSQDVLVGGTIAANLAEIRGENILMDGTRFETGVNTKTLLIDAGRSVFLGGSNGFDFGRGEGVMVRGGENIVAATALLSRERDLTLQAPVVKTQLIDTSIAGNGVGGAVKIEGLNGNKADAVGFGNVVTPRRDVNLRGERVSGQFVITNATTGVNTGVNAGRVGIEGGSFVGIGGVITEGRSVSLMGSLVNGLVQSGLIMTNGGDITLSSQRVNGGALWASARDLANGGNSTGGRSGNITVNGDGRVMADRVEANAPNGGVAGTVVIRSEKGEMVVDSVQAYGGSGGTVRLEGDRVRVTGTALERGVQPFAFSSIRAGDSVEIRHRGGVLNQDFVIGNSGVNGTNGRIVVGSGVLGWGSVGVKSETHTDRPMTGLQITGVNSVPQFPSGFRGIPIVVTPGVKTRFTLAELGVPLPKDGEGDRIQVYLRPRSGLRPSGRLSLSSGEVVNGLVAVRLTDQLVYEPSAGIGAAILDEFEMIPLDLPAGVESLERAQRLPLVFTTPVIPGQDEIAAPELSRQVELPEDSGMSNVSLSEVALMDKELSQDFEGMGDGEIGNVMASLDGRLMREIEQKTGVRPAIVYVRTLRREVREKMKEDLKGGEDSLELTVLTSRGRFRRRIAIDAGQLDAEVAKFRREVTNPIRTHTTSYLPMAQRLYDWVMRPILADLKSLGITNLAFIPEAGLRGIPYGALHDGKQFLIEQYSVGLMPSLGLVQAEYRNLRNGSVLSLGISQSTQGQAALPMVEPEIRALGQLWGKSARYLNDRVTLGLLQGARQERPFEILHLATHANFVAGKPKEAYIQLWNDRLRLEQLRQLGWSQGAVELMVLSACKTAVGDRDSELGFAGLALQSGVKTAVASLWSVNDTATMGLIGEFYGRLLVSPVKGEALRLAQIAMLRGEIRVRDGKLVGFGNGLTVTLPEGAAGGDGLFRHPYYWSAFTVVGSPW